MKNKPIGSSFENDAMVKQSLENAKKSDIKITNEFCENMKLLKQKKEYLAKLRAEKANKKVEEPKKSTTKKEIEGLLKDMKNTKIKKINTFKFKTILMNLNLRE